MGGSPSCHHGLDEEVVEGAREQHAEGCTRNDGEYLCHRVVVFDDDNKLLYAHSKESETASTNNEQEMLAILYALMRYGREKPIPDVYTDSSYAYNTFIDWMYRWKKNNWLTSTNTKPKNLDIVKMFYEFTVNQHFKINLHLIKGHSEILGNELADKLATGEKTVKEVIDEYS